MSYKGTPHEYNQAAYAKGEDAALAAASWVIDGNTSQEHIRRMVKWFDDGDPQLDQFLPAYPNLSGEMADGLTPSKLVDELIGDVSLDDDVINEICDAFEEGVADHFRPECERILRAAVISETEEHLMGDWSQMDDD